jgi:hypothetical protein
MKTRLQPTRERIIEQLLPDLVELRVADRRSFGNKHGVNRTGDGSAKQMSELCTSCAFGL